MRSLPVARQHLHTADWCGVCEPLPRTLIAFHWPDPAFDSELRHLSGARPELVRPCILQPVRTSTPYDRAFVSAIWQRDPVRCLRPARQKFSTAYSVIRTTSAVRLSESLTRP